MVQLLSTAVQHAALHAITIIINQATAVCQILVPVMQRNVRAECRRRVQAANGVVVLSVLQTRFVVVAIVYRVAQTNMYLEIHVKRIALRTVVHMEIHARHQPMEPLHVTVEHADIHARVAIVI